MQSTSPNIRLLPWRESKKLLNYPVKDIEDFLKFESRVLFDIITPQKFRVVNNANAYDKGIARADTSAPEVRQKGYPSRSELDREKCRIVKH